MQTKLKTIERPKNKFYRIYGKRALDLFIVIPALIISWPLLIIIGLIIKLDSTGPIIYKQKRVGKDKLSFYIYKLRTMVSNADEIGGTSTKAGDSRITNTGTVLRRTSIDELPQLVNVLVGNMSIVGYRPGVRDDYSNEELVNGDLFSVKPGITGYAQVNGRSHLTLEEKRYWEKKYIQDISFCTDLKIIIRTIGVVLKLKNIV